MSAAPSLWIVSELYYPELTSTGYYITSIAEHLATDSKVHVICGQPNYAARGERAATHEVRNNVAVTRVSGLRLNKNVIPFRLLNVLSLSLSVFISELARFKSGNRILVVTTPPLLPFVTALAALIKGAGYTLLVHDVYPEQLYATGILKKYSIVGRSIDLMNRWVYKHAQGIITVGRDMQELLRSKTEGFDLPVWYIANWGEVEEITPQPREGNELLKTLGLENKFVVLSAGNLGRPNDLETLINAAELLAPNDQIAFLFIGGGAKEKWLRERTEQMSNVVMLPPMPQEQQQTFLNAGDAAVASFVSGMWGAAVPSRIYNYLAAGKPIIGICDPGSEIARVIDEEGVGVHVVPGDARGLARAISHFADSPDVLADMSTNARQAAVAKYSANDALSEYHDLLTPGK